MNSGSSESALYIPDPMDCLSCNQCIPHCPTFKLQRMPQESPQGRLKLISKVLHDGQPLSHEEVEHLDNCLECRACERVCPSKMRYTRLLGRTRVRLPQRQIPPMVRAVRIITRYRGLKKGVFSLLRFYQRSGIELILKKTGAFKWGRLNELNKSLPRVSQHARLQEHYPVAGIKRGTVALFTGCLTDVIKQSTLHSAVKLLRHLGYEVIVPRNQHCCGAIHAHNGGKKQADELAELNLRAFSGLDVDAILYTASGCGSTLRHYKRRNLSAPEKAAAEHFESRLVEINQFIANAQWPEQLELKPCTQRVVVHEPCSQQYPLASHKSAYEFLQRIPQIDLQPLAENNVCCGAGGSYMLSHSEISEAIREDKMRHLVDSQADILLTSNIGCALHLGNGIRSKKLKIEVMHPVDLLARQICG